MWSAMRILRQFDTHELVAVCELKSTSVALSYLHFLRHAGYVKTTYRSKGGNKPARHTLVRDTGHRPPAIVKYNTVVWDPNTDIEYVVRENRKTKP
jgi:hypothetical protein